MSTTRFISATTGDATGLPILPHIMAAPNSGEVYPFGRAIYHSSAISDVLTSARTWIAQDTPNGHSIALERVDSVNKATARYYMSDPATINWTGITLTGRRPRTPLGGLDVYNYSLGLIR